MRKLHSLVLLCVLSAVTTPLAADDPLDTEPIISALIELAESKDADAEVRYAAFNALKSQPRSDRILELYWRGLDDDSVQTRNFSLDRIVALEGPTVRVLTRLISLLEKRRDNDERRMAYAAQTHLVNIGAPAVPYLIESLKRELANTLTVSALGHIPLGEYQATVATQLTALLKSEDKAVQLEVVRSLQNIMIADAKAKAKASAKTGGIDPRYLAYYTKLLQKYDSNADDSLTKDEWSKMSKDPAAADTDQDGKITIVEFAKWSMRPSN